MLESMHPPFEKFSSQHFASPSNLHNKHMLLGYINLLNQIVGIEAFFKRPYIKVVKV